MKIASVFAAMPGNYTSLMEVKKIVVKTLTELGVEPEDINLGYRSLPYYDGIKSEYMNTISDVLRESDGVILYAGASFGLPGALVQTLVEHFNYAEYQTIINQKNCFIIMECNDGTGVAAMSALDTAIYHLGGFPEIRLLIDKPFAAKLGEGDKNYILVERLCEDYYRVLRQQRVMYRPKGQPMAQSGWDSDKRAESPQKEEHSNIVEINRRSQEPNRGQTAADAIKAIENLGLDQFNENQQKDIDEISKFFAGKANPVATVERSFSEAPLITNPPAVPQKLTLAQKTSSLSHYFKAGQSDGLKAEISLQISGGEGFEGYLEINGIDCDFHMGQAKVPDVTIIAEDSKWGEIIKGKISAQKAFMIGQIKVRGNFVLLSRFDQLFDFDRNVD